MSLKISENGNKNYLAQIVELKNIRKHENADRLRIVSIDFNDVIIGESLQEGDTCVYFPVESAINPEFIKFTNSFRDSKLNVDQTVKGYFESNGRVRAVKLRGEKSCGCLFPISDLSEFIKAVTNTPVGVDTFNIGTEFDYYNDIKICEKFIVPIKNINNGSQKNGKKSKQSRISENQFHFHTDTENLRKNVFKIKPDTEISISYKVHGTSSIASHILLKKELNLFEKIIIKLENKIPSIKKYLPSIKTEEYGYVFASRKVIKKVSDEKIIGNSFYDTDIWSICGESIKEYIPKGFTIYFEIVGFMPSGSGIQSPFDYGCKEKEHKIYVYRITNTTPDGHVFNLGTKECEEFCLKCGLNFVPLFFHGTASDMFPVDESMGSDGDWQEGFVKFLEKKYNEKNCYLCKNKVPEEGIVLRVEKMSEFEAYKLKSFAFLEYETKELDKGVENIEDAVEEETN